MTRVEEAIQQSRRDRGAIAEEPAQPAWDTYFPDPPRDYIPSFAELKGVMDVLGAKNPGLSARELTLPEMRSRVS